VNFLGIGGGGFCDSIQNKRKVKNRVRAEYGET